MGRSLQISPAIRRRLHGARIAHLATLGAKRRPHVVPVCFVYDGAVLYTAIDSKPKRVGAEKLARVRNIRKTPPVALLIDEYYEDWRRLWYVLVRGTAKLIPKSAYKERAHAIGRLRAKYPQYAAGMLRDDAPIIRITPDHITSWGEL